MGGSTNKTLATPADVAAFIAGIADTRRREEALALDELHRRVTGLEPRMWGPSIIGYGSYRYRYESGREGVSCRGGFSPRKPALTVYLMGNYCNRQSEADALFAQLGPHTTGKACLYIKKLEVIDLGVLENLVALSWLAMREAWPLDGD